MRLVSQHSYALWCDEHKSSAYNCKPINCSQAWRSTCRWCGCERDTAGHVFVKDGVKHRRSPRCIVRPPLGTLPAPPAPDEKEPPRESKASADYPGHVYFVACGGIVKIGWATDPARRIRDLSLANPSRLELLLTLPGTKRLERSLHASFAWLRVRGEWFTRSAALDAFIAEARSVEKDGRAA